jgi:broad specificity phosphatase PhoE
MVDIFLIRHAETMFYEENNSITTFPNSSVLTNCGHLQAQNIAERLMNFPVKRLLSSPLSRAIETAKYIADYNKIEIEVRTELKEQDRGPVLSKIKSEQLKHQFPDEWKGWQSGKVEYTPPGGESIGSFLHRVDTILSDMETSTGLVVAVTHFGFIQGAICLVLRIPFRFNMGLDIREASITHIRSDQNERALISLNGTYTLFPPDISN